MPDLCCIYCGEQIQARRSEVGHKTVCPACGGVNQVPELLGEHRDGRSPSATSRTILALCLTLFSSCLLFWQGVPAVGIPANSTAWVTIGTCALFIALLAATITTAAAFASMADMVTKNFAGWFPTIYSVLIVVGSLTILVLASLSAWQQHRFLDTRLRRLGSFDLSKLFPGAKGTGATGDSRSIFGAAIPDALQLALAEVEREIHRDYESSEARLQKAGYHELFSAVRMSRDAGFEETWHIEELLRKEVQQRWEQHGETWKKLPDLFRKGGLEESDPKVKAASDRVGRLYEQLRRLENRIVKVTTSLCTFLEGNRRRWTVNEGKFSFTQLEELEQYTEWISDARKWGEEQEELHLEIKRVIIQRDW